MSKNILVVDDAPVSLKFIGYFLRKEGYEVTEASNGVEAIELIDNSRFGLVLSDGPDPSALPQLVAAFVAHNYRHVLRRRDVIAGRKARQITIEIPANFDLTVLECRAEPSAHNEFLYPCRKIQSAVFYGWPRFPKSSRNSL
jgi:CheY-like chemotaxis protein